MFNFFWAEAVNVAIYIKNRFPSRTSPDKAAFERWYGTKPNIKHIHTFGCLAYAWNPAPTARSKLDDRALRTIFLGYTQTNSQYRFNLATKKLIISRLLKKDRFLPVPDLPDALY